MADTRASWAQFDTASHQVNVSWLQFDTLAATGDTRVSWLQFDTLAPATDDRGWTGGGPRVRSRYPDHRQTKEQEKAQRIELGIIEADGKPAPDLVVLPPKVKKIIRQVAKDHTAPEKDTESALDRLQKDMERQQLAFRKEMGELMLRQRDEMRSRDAAAYAKALKRMQDDDDEAAHLLLM